VAVVTSNIKAVDEDISLEEKSDNSDGTKDRKNQKSSPPE